MAKTMLAAGAVGFVTNGAVRDLEGIRQAGLKTFGGGCVANHTSLRWSGLGDPVVIGGLLIRTGDLLHGDGDGLIVLPEDGWDRIVYACRLQLDFEKAAHIVMRRTDFTAEEKERRAAELYKKYMDKLKSGTEAF
jgi:regulator of RNase E activity RraA